MVQISTICCRGRGENRGKGWGPRRKRRCIDTLEAPPRCARSGCAGAAWISKAVAGRVLRALRGADAVIGMRWGAGGRIAKERTVWGMLHHPMTCSSEPGGQCCQKGVSSRKTQDALLRVTTKTHITKPTRTFRGSDSWLHEHGGRTPSATCPCPRGEVTPSRLPQPTPPAFPPADFPSRLPQPTRNPGTSAGGARGGPAAGAAFIKIPKVVG